MSKVRNIAACAACGHVCVRWVGQCPSCGAWGTIEERRVPMPPAAAEPAQAQLLTDVPLDAAQRLHTGIGELDRVLGGGLVPGSIVVLGGAPGVGKSTLMLQAAARLAIAGDVLYVTAEESAAQLRLRADRLDLPADLLIAATGDVGSILALVDRHEPDVVVVDSIQTVADHDLGPAPGSTVQVREAAAALARAARDRAIAVVVVGHVTKEGALAGPKALEHLVDVVLSFDGDRHHALRLVRATKNRFGSTGETGCFTMGDAGLEEVVDPSRLFLDERREGVAGSVVTVALEGPRPLAVEVQALVAPSPLAIPRRQVTGLDASRVQLLAAVLERRADVALSRRDLFASVVGGVRVREVAVDLACCLALGSSESDRPLRAGTVAIGEVGLSGEVRAVPFLARRLAEAARLGCVAALVPASYDGPDHGLRLDRVPDVATALRVALARPARVA